MSARVSLRDAVSLGLFARADAPPAALRAGPAALAAALLKKPARANPKGGRHRVVDLPPLAEIRFVVSHAPRTKQRARTQISKPAIERAFLDARGNLDRFRALMAGIRHRSYTPKDTEDFERLVGEVGRAAMRGRDPFAGPVEMELVFAFEGDPGEWPTDVTDADLDNAAKAILDGLNGVLYVDDRFVVRKRTEKVCARTPSISVVARLLPSQRRRDAAPAGPHPEAVPALA